MVDRNKFVLPGAWHGPYCPIYGLTFILLLAVFRKKDKMIINILKIAITVTITEYVIAFISETFFNHVIWNYSKMFLNIHGRVCLKMSTIFTISGTVAMYTLKPFTKKLYNKIASWGNLITYINIILSIIMISEMIFTIIK